MLLLVLSKEDLLSKDELFYVIKKTDNKSDYITLNHLEKMFLDTKGETVFAKKCNKIQFIMGLLLNDELDKIYLDYKNIYNAYKQENETDKRNINLYYVTLIHIAMKNLRQIAE